MVETRLAMELGLLGCHISILSQRLTLGLTESAHRVVDVAGWADSVHVDRPDNKLVLCFWY